MASGSRVTGVQAADCSAFPLLPRARQYEVSSRRPPAPRRPEHRCTRAEARRGPSDFRLWVCLHEVPSSCSSPPSRGSRTHLEGEIAQFVEAPTSTTTVLRQRVQGVLRSLADAVRAGTARQGADGSHPDPAQRAVLDRVTALMSLVEGQPSTSWMRRTGLVPSVRTLRKRFAQRRKGTAPRPRAAPAARLEQKMKQYAEGRVFVGGVIDLVGMEGFKPRLGSPRTCPDRGAHRSRAVGGASAGRPAIPA